MKKIISILLIVSALFLTGCGKKNDEVKNETDTPVKTTEEAPVKTEAPIKTQVINTDGEDVPSLIEEFNQLEDGDPKKEEIREKLEQIFEGN